VPAEYVFRLARRQSRPRGPACCQVDWEAARRSVEKLAQLMPSMVLTGHGPPSQGEAMREALHRLAADFDRVARPGNRA
jgi:hypothetical protein